MLVKLSSLHSTNFEVIKRPFKILFSDLLPANLTIMIPNAIRWCYQRLSGRIKAISIKAINKTAKKADLFAHNLFASSKVLLLLHGDHAHPFSTLHLAEIGKKEGYSVFSLKVHYDHAHPDNHQSQLHKAALKINKLMKGNLIHFVVAGHSRGATEAAREAVNNPFVSKVISLSGRFKKIDAASLNATFYQVAAINDWCINPDESIVRNDQPHLLVDASHLSMLNHPSTLAFFKQALRD